MDKAPLNDTIITALCQMIDDSQVQTREPSHSEIEYQFKRVDLLVADPNKQGRTVGKAKRLRAA